MLLMETQQEVPDFLQQYIPEGADPKTFKIEDDKSDDEALGGGDGWGTGGDAGDGAWGAGGGDDSAGAGWGSESKDAAGGENDWGSGGNAAGGDQGWGSGGNAGGVAGADAGGDAWNGDAW